MKLNFKNYNLLVNIASKIADYLSDRRLKTRSLSPIAINCADMNNIEVNDYMLSSSKDKETILILFSKDDIEDEKIVNKLSIINSTIIILKSFSYYDNLSNKELISELINIFEHVIDNEEYIIDKYYRLFIIYSLVYNIIYSSFIDDKIISDYIQLLPEYINDRAIMDSSIILNNENNFNLYSILADYPKEYELFKGSM